MKLTVLLLTFCMFALAYANVNDPTQIEKYDEKIKSYQLDVPGKEPITIIETGPFTEPSRNWEEIAVDSNKDNLELNNLMTHIIHNVDENNPRCYGPSCQEGFNPNEGPQKESDEYSMVMDVDSDKQKDYRDFSQGHLDAITALAAKLKNNKIKSDRLSSINNEDSDEEGNGKVYTTWNRLKVKQHKHPFDDKDGWVTLEPVAWSTSKISKWKPNVKKHKPVYNDDNDRYPSQYDDPYNNYQGIGNGYSYTQNKPSMSRPQFINNKLHVQTADFDSELPSKPSWMKPQAQGSFASSWSPDDSRRPHKPNCDHQENSYSNEDMVYYGVSDSLVTDHRPSNFPHDFEALHQSNLQRPMRRPTQVVYAGTQDFEGDRSSRPPYGDGQWVLLSTTKGYRNKKRQRSLNPEPVADDRSDYSTVTSHQAVALTVLPVDNAHTNMTTSHGGLLEVEKSFQTVEESKRDMDKIHDLGTSASQHRPVYNKMVKRKIVSNVAAPPDSSTVLAAVGAGMVPAAMAMVVPMMFGRRRRRELNEQPDSLYMSSIVHRYE